MIEADADFLIRDATPADAEVIAEFNARLAEETEHLRLNAAIVRRGVARVLGDASKGRYFVAAVAPTVVDGSVMPSVADESVAPSVVETSAQALPAGSREVVACTMVTYEWSDWRDANLWWIQSVYVRSDWRRRGVFRALYRHVRQAALDAGAGGLRLYVERENEAAQRTYAALGMSLAPYAIMAEMFHRTPGQPGSVE